MSASSPVTLIRGCRASARAAAIRSGSGASPRLSLSGLPGVTSHQTRCRSSRFMAIRLAERCAAWGGSKLPPNRPIRMPRSWGGMRQLAPLAAASSRVNFGARSSRPDLSAAAHAVLEGRELLDADRAARMEAAGRDADLGPEAELAAVGELGRGIVQNNGRIDLAQELLRRRRVGGDDGVGVMGAIALHMRDRALDPVHQLGRDDGVEILGRPVGLARRLHPPVDGLPGLIAPPLAAGVPEAG